MIFITYVGIKRDELGLNKALYLINSLQMKVDKLSDSFNFEKYELENALSASRLIATAALKRKNSIGAHFREDTTIINKEKDLKHYDKVLVE